MLPRDSEAVERRQLSRRPPRFYVELRTDAPNEFRRVAFSRKHSAQKKQITRLHSFHIGAEWLRRRRELDAKRSQPLLGASEPRGYFFPFRICIHFSLSPIEILAVLPLVMLKT